MDQHNKRVTLDDLAAHLNLSKFSVSRALGGKEGVSTTTRKKVFDAARQLGYHHPNLITESHAEHLQIQFLIPKNDAIDNTFWIDVMSGAEAEAHRLNCDLITVMLEQGHTPRFTKKRDGILFAGRRSRQAFAPYLETSSPALVIGYPAPGEQVDAVMVSSWEAGIAIGEHLKELGHRHLAYLTDAPDDLGRNEKLRGIEDAFCTEGADIQKITYNPEKEFDDLYNRIFSNGKSITAIVAASERLSIAALLALSSAGLSIPDDISLVGSDNSPRVSPGRDITSSIAPMQQLGAMAISTLIANIREPSTHAPLRIMMTPKLVIGKSTTTAKRGTTQ